MFSDLRQRVGRTCRFSCGWNGGFSPDIALPLSDFIREVPYFAVVLSNRFPCGIPGRHERRASERGGKVPARFHPEACLRAVFHPRSGGIGNSPAPENRAGLLMQSACSGMISRRDGCLKSRRRERPQRGRLLRRHCPQPEYPWRLPWRRRKAFPPRCRHLPHPY